MFTALTEKLPPWLITLIIAGIVSLLVLFGAVLRRTGNKKKKNKTRNSPPTHASCDCSVLLELAGKSNGRAKTVLLTAGSLQDLPITQPVQMAMQLTYAEHKCLLIDLDTKRDALARVFEIACDKNTAGLLPVRTPIENMDIWPANYFSRCNQLDLKSLRALAEKKYDFILLNIPYLTTHPDRVQIVRSAEFAVMFGRDPKNTEPLQELLETGTCKILAPTPDQKTLRLELLDRRAVHKPKYLSKHGPKHVGRIMYRIGR